MFCSSCAACMSPFHSGSRITEANDKEYHYECFCCEKCSIPINGTFTMNSDGSRFKVNAFSEKSQSDDRNENLSVEIVFDRLIHPRRKCVMNVVNQSNKVFMVE